MECPKCGTANKEDAARCRICGAELMPKLGGASATKMCPFCNARNEIDAVFCARCNKLLGEPTKKTLKTEEAKEKVEKLYERRYSDYPSSAQRTARLGLAGIILIMAGIFSIADVAFTIGIGVQITHMQEYDELVEEDPRVKTFLPNLAACESIRLVFACIALFGGLAAMRRLGFGMAAAGAIFGILASGSSIMALVWAVWGALMALLFLGSILALVLIAISRREFMLT